MRLSLVVIGLALFSVASCDSPTEPGIGLSFEWERVAMDAGALPPSEARIEGEFVIVTGYTMTSDSCSDPTALVREGRGLLLELHEEYSGRLACLPSVQHYRYRAEIGPIDRDVVLLTVFFFFPDHSQILLETVLGIPEP